MRASNRRVLIVDDNQTILSLFSKTLAQGTEELYEISSAQNGTEALRMVEEAAEKNTPFALIFMDVRMPPGWNGIETIRRIWAKYPYTEVVVCTAFDDYTDDEINSILGHSHRWQFLKKPFDPKVAKQMALALTTKWNLEAQVRSQVETLERQVQERTTALQDTIQRLTFSNQELDANLRKLEDTQAQLFHANKMAALGEMAGGLAHEINTPLGIIQILTNQIQEILVPQSPDEGDRPIDRKELLEAINLIESTVVRISKIVAGLKRFSRDDNTSTFETVRIGFILEDSLALCAERLKSHGVQISVSSQLDELEIDCRPIQISQVLLNLLNNAFDAVASLKEKWIRIDVNDLEHDTEISVTNSGPKVPEHIMARMFQPFFTTKELGKGTGLGLSISLGMVQAHHGTLFVDPEAEHTCLRLRLPKRHPSLSQ